MDSKIKVRFAPSPTGVPHVGNIRTALFDYFFSKANNGIFMLRLEDTDQARKIEGAEESIKESLTWLGAKWDEFFIQSDRLEEYTNYAKQLVKKGLAKEEEGAVRFIVPKDKLSKISWTDAVGNKEVSYNLENVEDFIILKADGYPTYHLANVVDDHLMNITHVIRGEDWIPSTPKHLLLYRAFEWEIPVFAHVPNVLGTDGKKLSKRKGAKSVLNFRDEGFLPEALLNYLMLLGWSPKNDREILSREEIVNEFSLEKINSAPAIFDERKLLWMNGEYIRQLSVEKLAAILGEYDNTLTVGVSPEDFLKYVASAQTRMKKLSEFKNYIFPFINPESSGSLLLQNLNLMLEKLSDWNKGSITTALVGFMQTQNIRYPEIYFDLIGQKQGLPLGDVFEILGKEKTLQMLK